jgi:RNA polymerase sigma factor (sigma-70 family)
MAARLLPLPGNARILDLIRSGDETALVELYRANRRSIAAYITRNSGSTDDAEDLLQEALIVLWERIRGGRFEATAAISTFVYATVKNMWLRKLATRRREARADEDPDGQPDVGGSPLDALIGDEQAALVRDALETLGDPCRTLLLLFYWDELSMEEIAGRMGLANAETAKSKKYQCKKALEGLLRKAGADND